MYPLSFTTMTMCTLHWIVQKDVSPYLLLYMSSDIFHDTFYG